MKTEREQIREMADALSYQCMQSKTCDGCFERGRVCSDYKISEKIYKAGYRKASDVIDAFVARLLDRFAKTETIANCLHGRTNTEIDSIIKIISAEMRKEFEK